ncbi:MAG: teichoic acid biosynthesis protein, partial [uncultured bacterium]
MQEQYILGVKVNTGFTMQTAVDHIAKLLSDGKNHYISTTNAEFVMTSQKDSEFKNIINKADLSLPDGAGILFADYFIKA